MTPECVCYVSLNVVGGIRYCDMHKAAPELLAALQEALAYIEARNVPQTLHVRTHSIVLAALAKATGQEEVS